MTYFEKGFYKSDLYELGLYNVGFNMIAEPVSIWGAFPMDLQAIYRGLDEEEYKNILKVLWFIALFAEALIASVVIPVMGLLWLYCCIVYEVVSALALLIGLIFMLPSALVRTQKALQSFLLNAVIFSVVGVGYLLFYVLPNGLMTSLSLLAVAVRSVLEISTSFVINIAQSVVQGVKGFFGYNTDIAKTSDKTSDIKPILKKEKAASSKEVKKVRFDDVVMEKEYYVDTTLEPTPKR